MPAFVCYSIPVGRLVSSAVSRQMAVQYKIQEDGLIRICLFSGFYLLYFSILVKVYIIIINLNEPA